MGTARWIHRPSIDLAVACCWVPIALAARSVEAHPDLLATLVGAVFLLSLSHQPLTLALVYGDPDQFRLRRSLFTWSPLVFVAAVWIGLNVSFVLVAAVAGLWNAEHTLMQRYGITRIYGRKAGQDDGGIERAMLLSWLVLAIVWAAADPRLPARIDTLPLGRVNAQGLGTLADLRPAAHALVIPVLLVVLALAAEWLRRERGRGVTANLAKRAYVLSTAALFVVMLVDPIAGFLAYVGAHAVEYFVIVHQSLGRRYRAPDAAGGSLGRAVRARPGRIGFFFAYIGAFVLLLALVRQHASPTIYSIVFLSIGGLHVFYDGFIWKLRRPAVARGFAIDEGVRTG